MERALRVTRPVGGLLAARCSPGLSSTRASPRLWQQLCYNGSTTTPQCSSSIFPLRHGRLYAARSNHTDAQNGGHENTQATTAAEDLKVNNNSQVPEGAQTSDVQAGDWPGGDQPWRSFARWRAAQRKEPKKMEPFIVMKNDAGIVEFNREKLRFRWWDMPTSPSPILSPLWLRDSCPCHLCVDPDSGQKNFATTDLHDRPIIESAQVTADRTLEITWAKDPPSGGASHVSVYSAEEVKEWLVDDKWQRGRVIARDPERILWDKAQYEALLAEGRCRVSYEDWMSDEPAFWDALLDLRQTGLITVTGVPSDEAAVERIANRIGPIQETFYGRTWDVKAKPHAENVAYTNKYLGLHQDLLYYDPVPGLQLLHCLSNSCEGGESLFSHGVRAGYELRLNDFESYKLLTELNVWFGYRKGDNRYMATWQTIKQGAASVPSEIRWAPPFQTTFKMASGSVRSRNLYLWKRAAGKFQRILEDDCNVVEFKLREGECVIFDNRIILHGRRQFETGSSGSRWLKGTYVSHQSYLVAAARLAEHLEAGGIQLPLARATWTEQEKVKQRLQERNPGGFEQASPDNKTDSVADVAGESEPVPDPSPIPSAKSLEGTDTSSASEPAQPKH